VTSGTRSTIETDPEQDDCQLRSSGAIVQEVNPQNVALVQPQSLGEWVEGLTAADVGARHDPGRAHVDQRIGDALGLASTDRREGSEVVLR
jgi:hypothetical protein